MLQSPFITIGIDPGIARCGYGVVQNDRGTITHVAHGVIETPKNLALENRLSLLHSELTQLFLLYKPQKAAVEELFFAKNSKTALTVGAARGVVLLALAQNCIPIQHLTPLQVKQNITSYGAADKLQVQKMVMMLLHLKELPTPDDAADGLALALCCASNQNFLRAVQSTSLRGVQM